MNGFFIFALAVLAFQIFLFFNIRSKKRKDRENDIIKKYDIKNASDAFRLIQDQSIPEHDRKKIEALYLGKE